MKRSAHCAMLVLLLGAFALQATAQTQTWPPEPTPQKPTLSLTPAVVMARGTFGQSLTQTLTLTNETNIPFTFVMVAEDVVVKDGKRVFVTAGETKNSIAATAVFSQATGTVKPHSMLSVDVRVTLPPETDLRAVAAIFRGTTPMEKTSNAVGVMASLGTLITFNLSNNISVKPGELHIIAASATTNLKASEVLSNMGTEPVVPEGMLALLDAHGVMVGKATISPQRLLPGEALEFSAEYPGQLRPGTYKALCSFQYESKTLTSEATFTVP